MTTDQEFFGKTYSLRPSGPSSDEYYCLISSLADELCKMEPAPELLERVRWIGSSRGNIHRLLRSRASSKDATILQRVNESLGQFTTYAETHFKHLRAFDRLDRTLTTTREQHHLAMMEIELANRCSREEFRTASLKLALLPHCLRDLESECKAESRTVDYVCKGCTDNCTVNLASKVLRLNHVKPFIWIEADLKSTFRSLRKEGGSLAVLGIACVPELVKGIRLCQKYGVPAVGVPLDANRCARWWGKFYPNSVNLHQLRQLLA